MFQIENNDTLIYESGENTLRRTIRLGLLDGKLVEFATQKKNVNLYHDQFGRTISASIYKTPAKERLMAFSSFSYKSHFDFLFTSVHEGHDEFEDAHEIGYGAHRFTDFRINSNHDVLRTPAQSQKVLFERNYKGVGMLYPAKGYTKGIATGLPHFCDLAFLWPFEENKSFHHEFDIDLQYIENMYLIERADIIPTEIQYEGHCSIELQLGKRVPYEVNDLTIDNAFEFEINFNYNERRETMTYQGEPVADSFQDYQNTTIIKGLVAFVGILIPLEYTFYVKQLESAHETHWILRSISRNPLPVPDISLNNDLEACEILRENFKRLTSKTVHIEVAFESVEYEPEVSEPSPAVPQETPSAPEVQPQEMPVIQEPPRPARPVIDQPMLWGNFQQQSEVERYLPQIESITYFLLKKYPTVNDCIRFLDEGGVSQLAQNPVYRKAFIVHLSRTFGIINPELNNQLESNIEDLSDMPIDPILEALEPYRKGGRPPDFNFEAQRQKDLERLTQAASETLVELKDLLVELEEKHPQFIEQLQGNMTWDFKFLLENLLEQLLIQPFATLDLIDNLLSIAESMQLAIDLERVRAIQMRLTSLRRKLDMVNHGILFNPTID